MVYGVWTLSLIGRVDVPDRETTSSDKGTIFPAELRGDLVCVMGGKGRGVMGCWMAPWKASCRSHNPRDVDTFIYTAEFQDVQYPHHFCFLGLRLTDPRFADGVRDATVIQAKWCCGGYRKRAGPGHAQSDCARILISERKI